MEIEAFIAAKSELEADLKSVIHDRLQRFKDEVGYPVASVDVVMQGYNFSGGNHVYAVADVAVNVPVPGM